MRCLPKIFSVPFIVALAVTALFGYLAVIHQSMLYLEVRLTSNVRGTAQVYYDVGKGLNEKNSDKKPIDSEGSNTVRFRLSHKPIWNLRFDPLNRSGDLVIKSLTITDRKGKIVKDLHHSSLKSLHQIDSLNIEGDELYLVTEKDANDPMLSVETIYPLRKTLIGGSL